ncbi:MAG: septum formation family protein [Acidimicrobiales bacterium]
MAVRQLAGAAVIGGVAIFGGVTAMGDDTVRDDSGAIVEAGGVGVFAIKYGDCLVAPLEGEVQSVEGVPCDQPHDSQAYDTFDLTGFDAFPGDALDEPAYNGCLDRFESFVGIPFEESILWVTFMSPTADGWAQGDREIQCLIIPESGTITFDAKNSRT